MKKLTGVDWQRASNVCRDMAADAVFVDLVRELELHPTHENHLYTPPENFEIGVEDCPRCEAFFALGLCVIEHLPPPPDRPARTEPPR